MSKKKKTSDLVEAPPSVAIKLDLGCGQNPKEGFDGVDLYGDKAKHRVDLFKFPWPFADNSVEEIHSSHFLEHVPAREIEDRDLDHSKMYGNPKDPYNAARRSFLGQDMLFAFMDECWRIMKVDAWMTVIVPSGRSNRAFQDPTHRRFFVQETFLYFAREWRRLNGLDHYRANCNFAIDTGFSFPSEEGLRAAEVQAERVKTLWNVTYDIMGKLKKQP